MAPSMRFSANESQHPGIGMLILLVASLLWSIGSLYSRSAKNRRLAFSRGGAANDLRRHAAAARGIDYA